MPPVSFNVTLSSPPAGGVVGGSPGVGTIYPGTVPGPSVSSVSSVSGNEGTSLVHTVTLSAATTASTDYAYSLGGGTSTSVSDYTVPPTFSAGVTLSGGTLTVPSGVSSFTVTVAALTDGATEGSETYNLTVGGVTGVGTISDSGASLITPSGTASRSSGVAPLAIFFDVSATTAAAYTTRPMHDLEFRTDFGDEAVSTWANGAQPGVLLKNIAFGMSAAHVYESAGTYNPTTQIRYRLGDGTYDTTTYNWPSITVTAADTQWAGTKTVSYSTTTDHTGAPSGCTQVSNVTDLVTSFAANKGSGDKRHLLRAGQTFPITGSIVINVDGPSMMGAFGSGAKPIISSSSAVSLIDLSSGATPTQVNDWRFSGIAFDGGLVSRAFNGSGSFSKVLIHNCEINDVANLLILAGSTLAALNGTPFTHAMWDEVYVVGNTFVGLTPGFGPNTIFANAKRMVVLGNDIDNEGGGEHCIRLQLCERGVISCNTVLGIAPTKTNLTIRSAGFEGGNTIPAGLYSEKVMVSDNHFVGGASIGIMGIGPQNGSNDERGRDMIVERNLFEASTTTQKCLLINQPDITVRNNLVTIPNGGGGGFAFGVQPSGLVPFPDRVNVYNNSVYMGGSSTNTWSLFSVETNNDVTPIDQTMPGAVFTVKNNILYTPNQPGGPGGWYKLLFEDSLANSTTVATNNTADASNTTSPLFNTNPPTTAAHFAISSGSYAVGAGTSVAGVYRDFIGTATPTTPDLGALVH